ncbi:(2Fe-2S)-binding protein [Mesorhizobium caraganae]|uniref:(2Fe-2S)-binding protein n=1 Tax=Mesorhizobium caraganae TaxID=483206 RepID=UPI00289FAE8A|nr:2Fe-2S iron-sulfur cluster-binding protein [Mesorhizobium caraganae]
MLNRIVTHIVSGGVATACAYTGTRHDIAADGVVLVTSRQQDDQVWRDLKARRDEWSDSGIRSIKVIGDAEARGSKVIEAWVANQVPQCGYCQSGQVMAATALLKQTPQPTEDDIAGAMVNLCRCGTYNAISAAVRQAAQA